MRVIERRVSNASRFYGCDACGGGIGKSERYVRHTVNDADMGGMVHLRMCSDCAAEYLTALEYQTPFAALMNTPEWPRVLERLEVAREVMGLLGFEGNLSFSPEGNLMFQVARGELDVLRPEALYLNGEKWLRFPHGGVYQKMLLELAEFILKNRLFRQVMFYAHQDYIIALDAEKRQRVQALFRGVFGLTDEQLAAHAVRYEVFNPPETPAQTNE